MKHRKRTNCLFYWHNRLNGKCKFVDRNCVKVCIDYKDTLDLTCTTCEENNCVFRGDLYNINGDCLAIK